MTTLNADYRDSLGTPLVGSLRITLLRAVANPAQDQRFTTVPATVALVNGQASFDLEPTVDDEVSYAFDVLDATGVTVESFTAQVPDSVVPVQLATLAEDSGITAQGFDASLSAIVRRLYIDDNFWTRARDTLAPYQGEYDATVFYRRGDIVLYQGSAWVYVAAVSVEGSIPSELATSFWRLWARKGEPGAGTTGSTDPYDETNWTGNTEAVAKASMVGIVQSLVTQDELDLKAPQANAYLSNPRITGSLSENANHTQLTTARWVLNKLDEIRPALHDIGDIKPWLFPVIPANWLHMDGSTFLDADYPVLAALFGKSLNLGGDAADLTRLPDLRGASLIGSDFSPNLGTAGNLTLSGADGVMAVVGSNDVGLTEGQMPALNFKLRVGNSGTGSTPSVTTTSSGGGSQETGWVTWDGNGEDVPVVSRSFTCYWLIHCGLAA